MSLVSHQTVAAECTAVDKAARKWWNCPNNTPGFHHIKVAFDLCVPQQAAHSRDSHPHWPCRHHLHCPTARPLQPHHCSTDCQYDTVNVEALAGSHLSKPPFPEMIKIRMSEHPGRVQFSRRALAVLLFVCFSSFTWAAISVIDIIALKSLWVFLCSSCLCLYSNYVGIISHFW